jgi:GNAT superfamily N-acetyltransferase
MVGFGRVVTDRAVFAYLMDVFILEEHRGKGLGKKLLEHIFRFPELQNLRRWLLATTDAHGLYERYGFMRIAAPGNYMEKSDRGCNTV